MRAVVLNGFGGPEVLEIREVPDPVPGPEQVVVDIAATALNRADLLQRRGQYPGPRQAGPDGPVEVPGMEFAGTVSALGEGATRWRVGDPVMGIVGGGAYAERLVVHERQAMPVPAAVALGDAAAIPEVFLTAFDALVVQGGLTSGRWALIHAGGSGVGTAAIQIARAVGARSIVTASAGKLERCRALGADVTVDYATQDFAAVAAEVTATNPGGPGVDVVLDVIGGQYTVGNIKALRVGGRIIQVGVMGEGSVNLPLGMLLPKRAAIIGTVLRSRPLEEKIALSQQVARELLPRFDDGTLAPVIDSRFPLDQVAAAHTYMESNANVGKILLDVAGAIPAP